MRLVTIGITVVTSPQLTNFEKFTVMQPIILQGQVYLNDALNEYAVIKSCLKGLVTYAGHGFGGMMDYERFMEAYSPVNPIDLEPAEEAQLRVHLPDTAKLLIGWVAREDDEELEFD